MTSAPIIAMILAKENAIQQWRELIGPTNSNVAKQTHPNRFYIFKYPFFSSNKFLFLN
jgi:nucleoside diphosphate kinase